MVVGTSYLKNIQTSDRRRAKRFRLRGINAQSLTMPASLVSILKRYSQQVLQIIQDFPEKAVIQHKGWLAVEVLELQYESMRVSSCLISRFSLHNMCVLGKDTSTKWHFISGNTWPCRALLPRLLGNCPGRVPRTEGQRSADAGLVQKESTGFSMVSGAPQERGLVYFLICLPYS